MDLKRLRETVKRIRRRAPRPVFCPSCGGADIRPETSFGILPPAYACRTCGYRGALVLEVDDEPEEPNRED